MRGPVVGAQRRVYLGQGQCPGPGGCLAAARPGLGAGSEAAALGACPSIDTGALTQNLQHTIFSQLIATAIIRKP